MNTTNGYWWKFTGKRTLRCLRFSGSCSWAYDLASGRSPAPPQPLAVHLCWNLPSQAYKLTYWLFIWGFSIYFLFLTFCQSPLRFWSSTYLLTEQTTCSCMATGNETSAWIIVSCFCRDFWVKGWEEDSVEMLCHYGLGRECMDASLLRHRTELIIHYIKYSVWEIIIQEINPSQLYLWWWHTIFVT